MLIVVSPAKTLDYESPLLNGRSMLGRARAPRLMDRSAELIETLITRSPGDIAALMGISNELAELNVERFAQWEPEATTENARPALFAFKGDVYLGLAPQAFDTRDLTHADKTLRILSGLYGVLRPLDLMQPYRLEMGTRLRTADADDLYGFWGDQITEVLNADLADRRSSLLVNLASVEYFKAVRPERLDARIVAPRFLDTKDGEVKMISFFAKRARGLMASWIIRNRISSARGLRDFDVEGYRYDADRSTATEPTFVRPEVTRTTA